MAVIGDLDTAARTAMVATVAGAVRGQVLGRESAADDSADRIAAAAVEYLVDSHPRPRKRSAPRRQSGSCLSSHPRPRKRSAPRRQSGFAGWLYGTRPHVTEQEVTDPSGTTIKLRFNNSAATANGFRASGASSLVSRYVVRRAGVVA